MEFRYHTAEAVDYIQTHGASAPRPLGVTKTLHAIARIAHEANRAFCEYNGDASQTPWTDAPEWQRSSAVEGVAFHLDNPDAGDAASHEAWMEHKLAEGWIYGEEKDPNAVPPTHPCLVPFDQLPAAQQFKDKLFRTIVHAACA